MQMKIGQCYVAKFTKVEMPVRIESVETNGVWKARSLTHGRIVFVKNESQILRECSESDLVMYAKTTMPNRRSRRQPPAPTLAIETPVTPHERKPKAKRPNVPEYSMTALDAAYRVLKESPKPLTSQQIVELSLKKKYHRSSGATPANTIGAAMLREIKKLGEKARFVKTGRGMFTAR